MARRNVGLMGQYAGFVTRAVAIVIDILIVIVAVLVITASISLPLEFFLGVNTQSCQITTRGPSLLSDWDGMRNLLCSIANATSVVVAVLTGPTYFIFLTSAGGQTIGKYVMRVRVVRLDGKPMNYWDGTLRWFSYLASLLPLGLGFFWVIVDDRRQSFHDKIAGSCVIYSWRAQQNERLLTRIQRFFGRVIKRNRIDLMRTLATQPVELVTLAAPGFNELTDLLRIVNGGIQNGSFEIIGLQEYAKSADGQINQLEVDPEFGGGVSLVEFSQYGGLTPARVHQIRDELPNDHFALAVLLREEEADKLVKLVARRTAAQIRRYELRHVAGQTSKTAVSSQSSPPALALSDAPVESDSDAAQPVRAAAPPSQVVSAPVLTSPPADDSAAVALPGTTVAELLAGIDALKTEQTALRIELATRNDALLRLETMVKSTEARLAGMLAARPVATPQDLTAIRGIGLVFQQRLYDAGIRTYAALAAATPDQLAQIVNAPRPAQPDYASWIAQAQELAGQPD